MRRWQWLLMQLTRKLWLRASALGMLGVVAAVAAMLAERFIPWQFPTSIGAEAVDSLLNIIASSMLAVTTFSLSVMTSAYGAATSNVTPRATPLLIADRITQTVLSTFLGAFLFSVVGIIALKTGMYEARGRVVMFIVTVAVLIMITISLLRWIDHLTRLGRVGETTALVEQATSAALQARRDNPFLGGTPLRTPAEIPGHARALKAAETGYVQHIDIPSLAACCEEAGLVVYVDAMPGAFVHPETPLAWLARPREDERLQDEDANPIPWDALREDFSIGEARSFDQDPRFGFIVLSEIASRALSPGINDAGTAIDVIGRSARLLWLWTKGADAARHDEPRHPRVHVPPLRTADLFEDAFMLLARDGAGLVEIQLRLQKCLLELARSRDAETREAALQQSRLALERSNAALPQPDRTRLLNLAGLAAHEAGAPASD